MSLNDKIEDRLNLQIERIENLKEMIKNNSYIFNSQAIAKKMLCNNRLLRFIFQDSYSSF